MMEVAVKLARVRWYSGAPSAVGMDSAVSTECRAIVLEEEAPFVPDDEEENDSGLEAVVEVWDWLE